MNKTFIFIGLLLLLLTACSDKSKENKIDSFFQADQYTYFGDSIEFNNVLSKEAMLSKYQNLKDTDTLTVQFESTITQVCKKKGCWLNVELSPEDNSFVRFKDYGFFAPLNSDNHPVILQGKAFVTTVSIQELKHYAKDAGKSEQEILLITEPKVTYGFTADGIAIKNN